MYTDKVFGLSRLAICFDRSSACLHMSGGQLDSANSTWSLHWSSQRRGVVRRGVGCRTGDEKILLILRMLACL